jgi:uncharacterized PurR-regulated membrane protein YhhQ (DUF165 family)
MKKADFRKVLASFFSVVAMGYLAAITFLAIPKENMDNAKVIMGFLLGTAIATLLNFYFGDSEGNTTEVSK